jgi:hypothetical protein
LASSTFNSLINIGPPGPPWIYEGIMGIEKGELGPTAIGTEAHPGRGSFRPSSQSAPGLQEEEFKVEAGTGFGSVSSPQGLKNCFKPCVFTLKEMGVE